MAWPVVIATNGFGIPVVEATNGLGTPYEIAANGFGTPVVFAANGMGIPVVQGGAAPLPFNTRMGAIGDSIIANGAADSGGSSATNATGIDTWGNFYAGSRVKQVRGGNKGIGGQGITAIAARYTTDLSPLNLKIVLVNGGINDLNTLTDAQIITQWQSIISQAAALGHILIILPITPSSIQAAYEATRASVNAFLASQASATVKVIDITGFDNTIHCWPEIVAPIGATIHPNVLGAQLLGARMATILSGLVASGTVIMTAADPLNLLPAVADVPGTSGTLAGGATGQVATSFTLTANGGATVVGSKSTLASGRPAQQVDVSGNYTGTNVNVACGINSYNISALAIQANEELEITAEVEFDAGAVNIDSIRIFSFVQDAGFANVGSATVMGIANTATIYSGGFVPISFKVPYKAVQFAPSAAIIRLNLNFNIMLKKSAGSSPVAGTMRFGAIGFRRVP